MNLKNVGRFRLRISVRNTQTVSMDVPAGLKQPRFTLSQLWSLEIKMLVGPRCRRRPQWSITPRLTQACLGLRLCHSHLCLRPHVAFSSFSSCVLALLSFTRTLVAFRPWQEPGWSHLQILDLTMSAETFLPRATFSSSRTWTHHFGGCRSTHYTYYVPDTVQCWGYNSECFCPHCGYIWVEEPGSVHMYWWVPRWFKCSERSGIKSGGVGPVCVWGGCYLRKTGETFLIMWRLTRKLTLPSMWLSGGLHSKGRSSEERWNLV